jgi:hypothetical protein
MHLSLHCTWQAVHYLGGWERDWHKKRPGIAAFPASKHPDKKGVRDVSLEARRHRDVRRRTYFISGEMRNA